MKCKISLLKLTGIAAMWLSFAAPTLAQSNGGIRLPSRHIAAGTSITVKLLQSLSSATAQVGDPVRVEVTSGASGLPYGTILIGQVTEDRPATPKRPGMVDIAFGTQGYGARGLKDVASARLVGTVAKAAPTKDVGIGAGAGALLGLARKGKIGDTLEGAALGALGGYAVTQSQRHSAQDLALKRGALLTVRTNRPLILQTTVVAG